MAADGSWKNGSVSILPAGTVTFLFTDIESSSGRWESRPDEMALVLSRHDELLREAVARHGGVVFKHLGDGLCAAFASAPAAMSAAIAGQAALQAGPWPGSGAPAVRMGLHSGDANPLGDDYFGPAVNRAARIMAVANGGQIVCSAATAELCRTAGLRDAGVHQLRGVGAERLHLVVDGYAVDSRPLRTASIVGNLHRPPTSFVGREGMTERLGSELARSRLVTLTGPGGVGKTRMAVETAWSSAGEYPDGAWLCELAPVADPDSVALAVASILALRLQEGLDAVDAVADGLAQRQLLLVLDNCEHVLGAAADLAEAILARAPRVTVLATSREPLTVAGERVWPVPPLDASVGGVQLFVDRAMAADGRFDPAANGDAMEEICSRLDGIPFAIELAAARVRALTPGDLAARLGDRFRLLSGGRRHGLGRHQTLRATVDWSYQLLDPAEQLLFDRLAVMAGSFDLAAAEAIGSDDVGAEEVLDLLASLVDKSMIVAHTGGRHTRYQLLETLRQFGEEHLLASGELARCRSRHRPGRSKYAGEFRGGRTHGHRPCGLLRHGFRQLGPDRRQR